MHSPRCPPIPLSLLPFFNCACKILEFVWIFFVHKMYWQIHPINLTNALSWPPLKDAAIGTAAASTPSTTLKLGYIHNFSMRRLWKRSLLFFGVAFIFLERWQRSGRWRSQMRMKVIAELIFDVLNFMNLWSNDMKCCINTRIMYSYPLSLSLDLSAFDAISVVRCLCSKLHGYHWRWGRRWRQRRCDTALSSSSFPFSVVPFRNVDVHMPSALSPHKCHRSSHGMHTSE